MTTTPKLALFALVLAAIFGGAAALGSAVGPIDVGGGHGSHSTVTPGMQMPSTTVSATEGTSK